MKKLQRIPQVTAVAVLRPFVLRVTFDDDAVRDVRYAPGHALAGGVFEPLEDQDYFASVTVDHGTLVWPNGVDLDPLVLHGHFAFPEHSAFGHLDTPQHDRQLA